MLKGISPIISPELLMILDKMGHGDEIVIVLKGDANLDGSVDTVDATCIARSLINAFDMSEIGALASDVNFDNAIDTVDATCVARSLINAYTLNWR